MPGKRRPARGENRPPGAVSGMRPCGRTGFGVSTQKSRRCFVTGVAPGLQNQWTAEMSLVGSTPMRLRQVESQKVPHSLKSLAGLSCVLGVPTSILSMQLQVKIHGNVKRCFCATWQEREALFCIEWRHIYSGFSVTPCIYRDEAASAPDMPRQ